VGLQNGKSAGFTHRVAKPLRGGEKKKKEVTDSLLKSVWKPFPASVVPVENEKKDCGGEPKKSDQRRVLNQRL